MSKRIRADAEIDAAIAIIDARRVVRDVEVATSAAVEPILEAVCREAGVRRASSSTGCWVTVIKKRKR